MFTICGGGLTVPCSTLSDCRRGAQIPERSGVPSAARGAGAGRFGLPWGRWGTPAVGYLIHCAAAGTDSKTAMSGMANDCRIDFVPILQAPLRWAEDTPTAAAGEETDVIRTVRSGAQREAGSAKKTRCRHPRRVLERPHEVRRAAVAVMLVGPAPETNCSSALKTAGSC